MNNSSRNVPLRRLNTQARLLAVAVLGCYSVAPAWAANLPENMKVLSAPGSASDPSVSGNVMTIKNSNGAILGWGTFNIGAGYTVNFDQAASSSVLNRVAVGNPSYIYGTLSSPGKVWLINPNGIMIGPGGMVNTAAFVASTLDVSNANFLAGKLAFNSTPGAGSVVNQGVITTPSGGSVYLVGANVSNQGIITTPQGETVLAAGETVNLIDTGTPGVTVEITGAAGNTTNLGDIIADAGRIGMAGVIVRNSGVLNASSVVNEGGRIFLKASQDTYVDGNGRIVAAGTKGGQVQVLGNRVAVMDNASIDASGANGGGTVLVGGDYQGKNADVQNAAITYFGPNATINADATGNGNGGKVILWADDTTRAYGNISARGGANGGNGGFVETSGRNYLDVTLVPDLVAPSGKGGTWLLDPTDITISSSASSNITGGSPFTASPSSSSTSTLYYGSIVSALQAGTSVIVDTTSTGTGNGDITIDPTAVLSNINVGGPNGATLTLLADRNINVNSSITSTGYWLNLVFTADQHHTGNGSINIGNGVSLITNNGDITMSAGSGINIGGSATISTGNTLGQADYWHNISLTGNAAGNGHGGNVSLAYGSTLIASNNVNIVGDNITIGDSIGGATIVRRSGTSNTTASMATLQATNGNIKFYGGSVLSDQSTYGLITQILATGSINVRRSTITPNADLTFIAGWDGNTSTPGVNGTGSLQLLDSLAAGINVVAKTGGNLDIEATSTGATSYNAPFSWFFDSHSPFAHAVGSGLLADGKMDVRVGGNIYLYNGNSSFSPTIGSDTPAVALASYGNQSIKMRGAGSSIYLDASYGGAAYGGPVALASFGTQGIAFYGGGASTISVRGGSGSTAGERASILSGGDQLIDGTTYNGGGSLAIALQGGSSSANWFYSEDDAGNIICLNCSADARAEIRSFSTSATAQVINGSSITLQAGNTGNDNSAQMEAKNGGQSIAVSGDITITGGSSGGAYYSTYYGGSFSGPEGAWVPNSFIGQATSGMDGYLSNDAGLSGKGGMVVKANNITLNGGGSTNGYSGAFIGGGPNISITAAGNLVLNGGTANTAPGTVSGFAAIGNDQAVSSIAVNAGSIGMYGGIGSGAKAMIGSLFSTVGSITLNAINGLQITGGNSGVGIGSLFGGSAFAAIRGSIHMAGGANLSMTGGTLALTDPSEIDLNTSAGPIATYGSLAITAPVVTASGGGFDSAIFASGDVTINASQQLTIGNNDFTGVTAGGNLAVNNSGSSGSVTMNTGGLFADGSLVINATDLNASNNSEFFSGTTLTANIGGNFNLSGGSNGNSHMVAYGDVFLKFLGAASTLSVSSSTSTAMATYGGSSIEVSLPTSAVNISFTNRASDGILLDGVATTTTLPGGTGFYVASAPAVSGAGLKVTYPATTNPIATQTISTVITTITNATNSTPGSTTTTPSTTSIPPPATMGTGSLSSLGSQTVGGGAGEFGGTDTSASGSGGNLGTGGTGTTGSSSGGSDSASSSGGTKSGDDKSSDSGKGKKDDKKSSDSSSGDKKDDKAGKKTLGRCNA